MMKWLYLLFLPLMTSCAWLAAHPKVESDLEGMGEDVIEDSIKTVEDAIGNTK